jgi:hypothetical protein
MHCHVSIIGFECAMDRDVQRGNSFIAAGEYSPSPSPLNPLGRDVPGATAQSDPSKDLLDHMHWPIGAYLPRPDRQQPVQEEVFLVAGLEPRHRPEIGRS